MRKPVIGSSERPVEPSDVYWTNHLATGTAAYGIVLAAVIRTAIYILIMVI